MTPYECGAAGLGSLTYGLYLYLGNLACLEGGIISYSRSKR